MRSSAPLTPLRCEARPLCKRSVHLIWLWLSPRVSKNVLDSAGWKPEAFGEFYSVLLSCLSFFSRAPQSPVHVRLRRASSLWTFEAVLLHTGLSLPCSSLSVTLCSGRDRRLRPYPCGLIFSMGAFPILYLFPSWCSRCARSCTVQVPSEQPCLLDWLTEL